MVPPSWLEDSLEDVSPQSKQALCPLPGKDKKPFIMEILFPHSFWRTHLRTCAPKFWKESGWRTQWRISDLNSKWFCVSALPDGRFEPISSGWFVPLISRLVSLNTKTF